MTAVTCIDPSIDIFRSRGGQGHENYTFGSDVFFLSWFNARIGGCLSAQFNVIRAINQIGTLQKGDKISIEFKGVLHWAGYVNDFISRDNDLEIRCIGAWVALNTIKPSNAVYGTEADFEAEDDKNEYADIATAKEILVHLYNGYLTGSDITKIGLESSSPEYQAKKVKIMGTDSFAAIAVDQALAAGDYCVGVDAYVDLYLVNPKTLPITQFKVCEASEFRITEMEKQESISWIDYPTTVVVRGEGGFSEEFSATDFGYPSEHVKIAGITINNPKHVVSATIGETESKDYTSFLGAIIDYETILASNKTIKSVDAARLADGIFLGHSLSEPEAYTITASRVDSLILPWLARVQIFDNNSQDRGVFLIESIEYESEASDINISLMEVRRF